MIQIEEIPVERIDEFWKIHFSYLVDDGIITDDEDKAYFSGDEYRGNIRKLMLRSPDKLHMIYFLRDGIRIGACHYCTYQSEDGKCLILDFWVFEPYRGNGTGHACFDALKAYTRADGALYYALNYSKEDSHRFWISNGFVDNGVDEYGCNLMIRKEPQNGAS